MPRRRGISDDDRRLWRQVTDTVLPIHATDAPAGEDLDAPQPELVPLPRVSRSPRAAAVSDASPEVSGGGDPNAERRSSQRLLPLLPGDLHDMDRRTAQRFRGGRLPIAARLDLHGLPAATAQGAFERFIATHHAKGHRCVLVITGKGQRSGIDGGVLKRELPHWLNLPHIRRLVLATTPAQPKDGGSGAMYILLKRDRSGAAD